MRKRAKKRSESPEGKPSPRGCLLGQVGTDVNDIVGDNAESDPAPDAVQSSIERSPHSMPTFENTDTALAACAPFLKLLEPTLLLPEFASWALGVMTRDGYPADPHLLSLGFIGG